MLGVTYKSFMLSVIMLNVIMLSVIMLNVIMLSVIMLNVIMLSVIMLNVVMLSVVAPFDQTFFEEALKSLFCSALVYT
jgi:archaellum biogenesis protein FlaJ (TadC family)